MGLCLAGITQTRSAFAQNASGRELTWKPTWRRVGTPEYIVTGAAGAGYLTLGALVAKPTEPSWSRPILHDEPFREWLRAGSVAGRNRASIASDVLVIGAVGYQIGVDILAVAWLGRNSPDIAWQMLVISAQAYAVGGLLNTVTKQLAARERPYVRECEKDDNYRSDCDNSTRFRSFYSGHSQLTATAAGLGCAHHTQLSLYRSRLLDIGSCVFGVAFTVGAGALRIVSDNHHATDVLVGHALGYATGYFMPSLLYYRTLFPTVSGSAGRMAVLPNVSPERAGLSLVGQF